MSQLEFPDPARDEIGELCDRLIHDETPSYCAAMVQAHHALCEASAPGTRDLPLDPAGRRVLKALAQEFSKRVYDGAGQHRLLRPELVPERIPVLEGRRISDAAAGRWAFYTEITNGAGQWLAYADLRLFPFTRGPAAMRVWSPRDADHQFGCDVILSPPAFAEDFERLSRRGPALLYEEPGSYLLCRMRQAIAQGCGDDDGDPLGFEVTAGLPRPCFVLETALNRYDISVSHDPVRLTVVVECCPAGPCPRAGLAVWRSGGVASAVPGPPCLFDTERLELAYLALCKSSPEARLHEPLSRREFALMNRMRRQAAEVLLLEEQPEEIRVMLELPRLIEVPGGERSWAGLIYCLDTQGRTVLVDGRKMTAFERGPAAYQAWFPEYRPHRLILQPLYSPEAFQEELELIDSHGLELMDGRPELSYLLKEGLECAAEAERRREGLSRKQVKAISVAQDGSVNDIIIQTARTCHHIGVELDPLALYAKVRHR